MSDSAVGANRQERGTVTMMSLQGGANESVLLEQGGGVVPTTTTTEDHEGQARHDTTTPTPTTITTSCQRLTFGKTMCHTFGILWDRLDVFAGFYVMTLPFLALVVLAVDLDSIFPDINEMVVFILYEISYWMYVFFVLLAGGAAVYTTACIWSSHETQHGGNIPTFGKAIKVAWKRSLTLVCAIFLVGLVLMLVVGVTLSLPWDEHKIWLCVVDVLVWTVCGIFLIWFLTGTTMVTPCIMTDKHNMGPLTALRRSFKLAAGHRGFILCLLFVTATLEQGLLALFLLVLGKFDIYFSIYLDAAFVLLTTAVFPALSSVLTTVIYISLAKAKEGLSPSALETALGEYNDENDAAAAITPTSFVPHQNSDNDLREPLI